MALIGEGRDTALAVRNALINPDGSVNRGQLFTMNAELPLPFGYTIGGSGVPGTEGRTLNAQLEDALASKLRLETGAQANEQELANIIERYAPSLFDNDSTIRDKLDRLVTFFSQAVQLTEPELADDLMTRAAEEGNTPDPPADEPDAEFAGFRGDGMAIFKRPDGSFFGVPNAGSR